VRDRDALVERTLAAGSQRGLAAKVGVSRTYINQLMLSKRSWVPLHTAVRIEDTLGVPRGSLFGFPDLALVAPYAREVGAA
jgi:transcriptional regulator with XRE-family HTH domain